MTIAIRILPVLLMLLPFFVKPVRAQYLRNQFEFSISGGQRYSSLNDLLLPSLETLNETSTYLYSGLRPTMMYQASLVVKPFDKPWQAGVSGYYSVNAHQEYSNLNIYQGARFQQMELFTFLQKELTGAEYYIRKRFRPFVRAGLVFQWMRLEVDDAEYVIKTLNEQPTTFVFNHPFQKMEALTPGLKAAMGFQYVLSERIACFSVAGLQAVADLSKYTSDQLVLNHEFSGGIIYRFGLRKSFIY